MAELLQVLKGVTIALAIGLPLVVGVPFIRYWLWLRRFRRENRIAKELWYREHAECCGLDGSYLNG